MGKALSVPHGVTLFNDILYVSNGSSQQTLDLYVPNEGAKLPVIIYIHGGSFRYGKKEDDVPVQYLTQGYAIASINYRLSQDAIFPAQIEDCKAAVRWLRAHAKEYRLDRARFAAWGASSGGYLAALLGATGHYREFDVGDHLDHSSSVQVVVDYCGQTDFLQMDVNRRFCGTRHDPSNSPESLLIGGPIQSYRERVMRANPITYITHHAPPFLICHGDADLTVPHHQSELLEAALKNAGVAVVLHTVAGGRHGHFDEMDVAEITWEFLARYMRPSFSNKALVVQHEEPYFSAVWKAMTRSFKQQKVMENTTVYNDIPYISHAFQQQTLDLFVPNGGVSLPLIIFIHGGGFRSGDKSDPRLPLDYLTRGFAIASINYRLSQRAKFPAQIQDCKAAIRWLRAHSAEYGLDPARFAVWGPHAGGYLATMVGTTSHVKAFEVGEHLDHSSAVQAVVDYSGQVDFLQMDAHRRLCWVRHNDPDSAESQLLGGPLQEMRHKAMLASPVRYITSEAPPFLICHGELDPIVPHHQSEILEAVLRSEGVPVFLQTVPNGRYPPFDDPVVAEITADFLTKHLHPSRTDVAPRTPEEQTLLASMWQTVTRPFNKVNLLYGASLHADVPYISNGGSQQKLDLYVPNEGRNFPVIIWIHGWDFKSGDKEDDVPVDYLTQGYAIASLNYRLSQRANFPAQIEDCKAAVRWLRANAHQYNLDPYRFVAMGAGAGGYLAALLGTTGHIKDFDVGDHLDQRSTVQLVVDYAGPTDFLQMDARRRMCSTSHDPEDSAESLLIGGPLQRNKDKAMRANPIMYVTHDAPPFLICHGELDHTVPHHQSELLMVALKSQGVPVTLHTVRNGRHMDPAMDPTVAKMTREFLATHLLLGGHTFHPSNELDEGWLVRKFIEDSQARSRKPSTIEEPPLEEFDDHQTVDDEAEVPIVHEEPEAKTVDEKAEVPIVREEPEGKEIPGPVTASRPGSTLPTDLEEVPTESSRRIADH